MRFSGQPLGLRVLGLEEGGVITERSRSVRFSGQPLGSVRARETAWRVGRQPGSREHDQSQRNATRHGLNALRI